MVAVRTPLMPTKDEPAEKESLADILTDKEELHEAEKAEKELEEVDDFAVLAADTKRVRLGIAKINGDLEAATMEYESIIAELTEEKESLQEEGAALHVRMVEALARMADEVGVAMDAPAIQRRPRPKKETEEAPHKGRVKSDNSIRALVEEYMSKHAQFRVKDVRDWLKNEHGRETNPGVELSKMVKENKIKSVERGIYETVKN